jgi:hypothetical protein
MFLPFHCFWCSKSDNVWLVVTIRIRNIRNPNGVLPKTPSPLAESSSQRNHNRLQFLRSYLPRLLLITSLGLPRGSAPRRGSLVTHKTAAYDGFASQRRSLENLQRRTRFQNLSDKDTDRGVKSLPQELLIRIVLLLDYS